MARNEARITRQGRAAVITLDGPPSNALDRPLRLALDKALDTVLGDKSIRALILTGAGGTLAGSPDLRDPEPVSLEPSLGDINRRLEKATIPVVAVLSGQVLGAGASLALACHFRVAEVGARIGFPEIALAQIPEGGATQRLPRLVGMATAASMLLGGRALSAGDAQSAHLVEDLVEAGTGVQAGLALAAERAAPRPVSALPVPQPDRARAVLADWRGRLGLAEGGESGPDVGPVDGPAFAQHAICDALAASLAGFAQGTGLEDRLGRAARTSTAARGLRATAMAGHALSTATPGARVRRVALMSGEAALVQTSVAALRHGLEVAIHGATPEASHDIALRLTHHLNRLRARDRITEAQHAAAAARVLTADAPDQIASAQIILTDADAQKRALHFATSDTPVLTPHLEGGAASSTPGTTLDDARLFTCLFGPGPGTERLWEIRPCAAAPPPPEAKARIVALSRLLRHIPVFAGQGVAPLAPRLVVALWQAVDHLVAAGASIDAVDAALGGWGFSHGPGAARDRIGTKPALAMARHYRQPSTGARAQPSDTALETEPEAITTYCVTALQNTAARLLGEPGVSRAAVDLAAIHGAGFPRWRGGPLFGADQEGAGQVLARVWQYASHDPTFWTPAPLLEACVAQMRDFDDVAGSQ